MSIEQNITLPIENEISADVIIMTGQHSDSGYYRLDCTCSGCNAVILMPLIMGGATSNDDV